MVKAVNTVVIMPMASVTAKPFTGPEPRKNNTAAAISVVRFASTMVAKALVNPVSIAWCSGLPDLASSRIRS
ncbi:hypothetical protein D3C87_2108950 [compost metagenome]